MSVTPKDSTKPSGPVQVGNLVVSVDRDLCIGAATCNAIAHRAFALDADSKAIVLDSSGQETEHTLIEAARGCPVAAIIIQRGNGDKVFPA